MKKLILCFLLILLCSCSSYKLATLNNDPLYPIDYVIPVTNDTKIDTINSFSDLKWKLRTDFNFRWDFAQYAMQQPYSWYWNNPRLDGIWRPYNRFDIYFYSNWFWTDWAWNYPYSAWGWNNWNYPYYYGWNQPYRPWNNWYNRPWYNTNYNVVWNASRRGNNVAYINGPRSSRVNNNIENTISRRYNNPRPNNNSVIDKIVNTFKENNIRVNINNNPPNIINNNNVIRNNYSKPNYNNNSRSNNYIKPPTFNNNSRSSYNSRPVISNSTRSSNTNISRGNSRGKN